MSSICFHAADGVDVRIGGRERAYMGCLVNDLLSQVLQLDRSRWSMKPDEIAKWLALLPADHYLQRSPHVDREALGLTFRGGDCEVKIGDRTEHPFVLGLNTALRMGGDAVKLSARLHGACEIHTYVEGEDRAWLADIIERNLGRVLRRETQGYEGWAGVVELLRAGSHSPVVSSYSVGESFPSGGRSWDEAMAELRETHEAAAAGDGFGLRLDPATWDEYVFDSGLDAWDVLREVYGD